MKNHLTFDEKELVFWENWVGEEIKKKRKKGFR